MKTKLNELMQARAALEQRQRLSLARQLAQNVADILSINEQMIGGRQTIDDALAELCIDVAPFIRDLGLTDERAFVEFIKSLKSKPARRRRSA